MSNTNLCGGLPALTGCKALELLQLDHNNLTGEVPTGWKALKHLRRLWLHSNPELRGAIPSELLQLPSLNLNIEATQLASAEMSFHTLQYPMYLLARDVILDLDTIVAHEEINEKLSKVTSRNDEFGLYDETKGGFLLIEKVAFFSHRWLRGQAIPAHPDNESGDKLAEIKRVLRERPQIQFVWLDFWWVDGSKCSE
jgi:hypothetical protein